MVVASQVEYRRVQVKKFFKKKILWMEIRLANGNQDEVMHNLT